MMAALRVQHWSLTSTDLSLCSLPTNSLTLFMPMPLLAIRRTCLKRSTPASTSYERQVLRSSGSLSLLSDKINEILGPVKMMGAKSPIPNILNHIGSNGGINI